MLLRIELEFSFYLTLGIYFPQAKSLDYHENIQEVGLFNYKNKCTKCSPLLIYYFLITKEKSF